MSFSPAGGGGGDGHVVSRTAQAVQPQPYVSVAAPRGGGAAGGAGVVDPGELDKLEFGEEAPDFDGVVYPVGVEVDSRTPDGQQNRSCPPGRSTRCSSAAALRVPAGRAGPRIGLGRCAR